MGIYVCVLNQDSTVCCTRILKRNKSQTFPFLLLSDDDQITWVAKIFLLVMFIISVNRFLLLAVNYPRKLFKKPKKKNMDIFFSRGLKNWFFFICLMERLSTNHLMVEILKCPGGFMTHLVPWVHPKILERARMHPRRAHGGQRSGVHR